jgi:hypothetical protein
MTVLHNNGFSATTDFYQMWEFPVSQNVLSGDVRHPAETKSTEQEICNWQSTSRKVKIEGWSSLTIMDGLEITVLGSVFLMRLHFAMAVLTKSTNLFIMILLLR